MHRRVKRASGATQLVAMVAAGLAGGVLVATDATAQFFGTFSSASYETGDEPRIDPGENAAITHTIWPNGSEVLTDLTFTVDYDAAITGARLDLASISTFNCGTPTVASNGLGLVTVSDVDPSGQCSIRYSVTTPVSTASGAYAVSPSNITGTGSVSGAIDHDWADFNIEVGVDSSAPAPVIAGPDGPVNAAFNVSISFVELGLYAEEIDGFSVSDLSVTNATVAFADLGGDGGQSGDDVSSVTIEVTPTGAGTPITVELPAATVVDQSGNANTGSNVYSVVYDVDGDPRDDVDFTAVFVSNPVDVSDQATLRFTLTNNTDDDLTLGSFALDIDAASDTDFVGVPSIVTPCGASSVASFFSADRYLLLSSMEVLAGASCSFDLLIEIDDALAAGSYGFSTTSLTYTLDGVSYTDTGAADTLAVDFAEGLGGTIEFTKTFAEAEVAPGDTIDVEFDIAATGAFTVTGIAFTDDLDAMLSGAVATGLPMADVCGAGSSLSGTSVLSLTGGNLASEGSCAFTVTISVPAGATGGTYTNTTGNLTATRSDDGAVTIDPASDSFDVNVPGGTPPSVTISGDTTDLGVAFSRDLGVRFGEPVTGLVAGDFDLTNATSSGLSGSGSDWTLTVTPTGVGAVEVFLPAAVVQDAEGDDNALSNVFAFDAVAGDPEIDVQGNSLSIADGDVTPGLADHTQFVPTDVAAGITSRTFTIENTGTDTLTITNVALSGADAADFSITSAAAGSLTPGATTTFTIQFDPSVAASRSATVTVTSNDADEASYDFAIAGVGTALPEIRLADGTDTVNIAFGDSTPSVADGTDFGSLAVAGAMSSSSFTIHNDGGAALTLGSDAVSISGSADFTVTVQPSTSVAASGSTTFTIQFDPSAAGDVSATVSIANDDTDEAPFLFGIAGTGTDDVPPAGHTVAFDAALYGPVSSTTASFTIDDPETLTDFSYTISSDGGGTNVTGSGSIPVPGAGDPSEFQVSGIDLSSLNGGALTVSVVLTDAAGNAATAVTNTSTLDLTGPTPVISTGSADPVSGAFTVSVDFGETVTGFVVGDISVGNGALSAFSDNGGGDYSATLTPVADGSVTVDVAGGAAQDAAGNDSAAATQFTIENDETAPTVALTTGSADPVSGAFTITATFSEDVTGFAVGDFTVGNGAASSFSATSATVYTATITPTADGTVTVDVAGGAAQDGAGNGNTAATQFTIENDETAPTVALTTGSADPVSGAFTITATFSEDVTGFAVGDFTVGNGAASGFSATSATVYTATITPTADGTVTVDVAGGAAQDAAGNGNTAATQFTIENDETGPTVALTTGSADPVSGVFTITATFSEDVTGFVVGDFTVGNGAASGFSATSATVYTATITPTADGTVTVDVAGGAAQDGAGNGNTAATQFTIENDETAPTVTLAGPASDQVGTFTVSATFSEDVTGLVLAHFTVGNGSASNLSGSGNSYTFDIAPSASGNVTVDLAANSAQDAAGNGNTAAAQFTVGADLNLPELASLVVSDADLRLEDVGGSVTLTATFSEAMDPSLAPEFSFSPDVSATLSLDGGAFSAGDTVYTATFSVADGGQMVTDVDATVSAAADVAGNALPDSPVADLFSVEMRRGSLSVAVAITGATDGVFDFSGDLGDFSIATVSQAGAISFEDLAEGSYTFAATTPDGFNLDTISCSGGTSSVDPASGSATVTLGPADSVSCEFTQIAEPDVDETSIPEVTIELPTLTDDPTSATSSFELQNVGGEAFYFTASTDQPWLVIDPTSGSIPATGSLEFTVSFTSAVLDLEPGDYSATITVVEVSPSAQRGGNSKANTLETINIPVAISIEPRLGDLTIITRTTAPEEGEGSFSYASTLAALDGQSVTTAGGSVSTTVNDVLRGRYTLTQLAAEGWDIASLSCDGDLDGGNVYDLANGQITIDLDAEENMVCTFTNRRNEDYIRGVTLSAIRNFMATRADLILTNSPRLAGRMRSNRSSATPNLFAADFRDGRLDAQLSTSLSALRQAVEETTPQQPGAERFSLNGRTGMSSLDIWMQASVSSVSDNRAGLGSDADFSIVHVGTDIMVSENVLAGILIQYDQTDMTTGDWNSAVEGNGWMVGPYMVARMSDRTYFDLRAAWGRSDNSVNPIGTYSDNFETDRWLIEANLAGDILHGGWRVTPGIGLAYFHESQDAYTDTLGIFIPGQTITIGRLSAGPELAYRFENADGGYVEPYLNITALYDYDDADVFNAAGTLQTLGHLRGDARLGLTVEMSNGGRISGEVSMIGLGEGEFEANNAMLRIRLPLSMH
ncbi:uncharacterized protein DUF1573 [Maricaulis maris]|uniref:Uncharacterized protein DUF1573 n=2 Tax=Maricaulis maris TaxID=74318 RepID=A0A495CXX4_9PROT|nr:uncharacterized protein DUF1573 [Maricaulis maris]